MFFLKAEQEVAHIERHTYCALAVGQRSSPWQQESGAAAWSLWLTQVCEQITSACTYTHINAHEMHIHKYTSFMRGINSQLQHQLPVSEQQKPFFKMLFCLFYSELQPSGHPLGWKIRPKIEVPKPVPQVATWGWDKSESSKFKHSAFEQKENKFRAWYRAQSSSL